VTSRAFGRAEQGQGAGVAEQDQGEQLLTYAELGARLGVSADGARTRAKRAGWPVVPGNDGKARVRVRAGELPEQPPERPPERPAGQPSEQGAITARLLTELRQAQAVRLADLRADLEQARADAELWRTKAEQGRVDAEREQAVNVLLREAMERERDMHRALVDELRARADRLEAELRRPWWRR
jgi:hypothetical protein